MFQGFIKVAAAVPEVKVADTQFNLAKIKNILIQAANEQVQVICFPELSLTAYTCGDLFLQRRLLDDAKESLIQLAAFSKTYSQVIIVGLPLEVNRQLFNVAAVIQSGQILGIVPKTHLPNNNEFYEKRWFSPANNKHEYITILNQNIPFGTNILFHNHEFSFGIEICEDLWVPIPPSSQHCLHGADLIFNLSATNELIGKHPYLRQLIEQQSARCNAGYIYSSAGNGESTTDLVYAGNAIIAENGKIIAASKRFESDEIYLSSEIDIEKIKAERLRNSNFFNSCNDDIYKMVPFASVENTHFILSRTINKTPFVPPVENKDRHCEEIFNIQVGGLVKRWKHTQAKSLVLGISGGLDSTLALLVCVKAADKLGWDRKMIYGVTMPGFGTTDRTYNNAIELIDSLGVSKLEISIAEASHLHMKDIGHDPNIHDVTYENTQARERTQILMNLANKLSGFVVGTGDLSELALGWATYNGDHMSMYGVNSGVPKTLVRYLVSWVGQSLGGKSNEILHDILETPVSPELLPADASGNIAQKTEDLVGPYELHDFYLYYFVRFGFSPDKILFLAKEAFKDKYEDEFIEKWLKVFVRRFFSQQFKRSCMPDGPKVGSINLSPRGDWRMPSDAVAFEV